MAKAVYGFGQNFLVSTAITYLAPSGNWFKALGRSTALGIPSSIIVFATLCLVAYLSLRFTKWGTFISSLDDNPPAARVTGIPTRPMMLLQYALAGLVAYLAGLVTAAVVNSMSTRVIGSTLVYDVILVAVIGGVGLGGGKGEVRNVVVGTLLIGILLNGMTILDMPHMAQNIVNGLILLGAIIVNSVLNPRDEQTAQQGDI